MGCKEEPQMPDKPDITARKITIQELRDMFTGAAKTIEEDVYIQGIITLTPAKSNIPAFIAYMQDATTGIALTVTGTNSLVEGSEVRILCKGIEMKDYNGLLQFGNIDLAKNFEVVKEVGTPIVPRVVTLAEIAAGSYESELVKIINVEFKTPGIFKGNLQLTDCTSTATVYTRNDATFANDATPAGNGTFIGVVSTFNTPQLLLRQPAELNMAGTRCGGSSGGVGSVDVCGSSENPVNSILEYFSNAITNAEFAQTGWRNIIVEGARNWQGKEFSGNKYVQATAHAAAAGTHEAWLITPPLDVNAATSKVLTFKTAQAYWKETTIFEVYVLQCINGATVKTKLTTPTLATASTTQYEFVSSGSIDLSAYSGVVFIGFRYQGQGGTSNSTTWCIDDIEFNNTATHVNFESTAVTSVPSQGEYVYNISVKVVNPVGATSITASGLPSWVTFTDNGDGTATLEGSAPEVTEDEVSAITLTATNNGISATQAFNLTVKIPGSGANLVINPGFEDWSATLPTAWDNATYNTGITKETSIIHSGANAVKHTATSSAIKLQQEVAITGGRTYEISYWYLDNDPNARFRIWSYWLNSTGGTIIDNEADLRPTVYSTDNAEWKQTTITLTAPATATKFRFELRTYNTNAGGGFIYFDDISIVEK
jgi:hypothetical protein